MSLLWSEKHGKDKKKDPFVLVVNEGSTEFANLDLLSHGRRIDFRTTAKAVIARAKIEDRMRGNFQLNLMFSGGENQRRGVVEVADHYGCAMPGVNVDSKNWIHWAVEMSQIAKKVGVPWVVSPNNDLKKRNQIFAERLHPDNVFEGITIAILELFPNPGNVREHVDKLNCSVYTHTLLFSQIVNLEGVIYRVLILGYMRKSCYDSMIRRSACQEVADACSAYMIQASRSQIPGMKADSYKSFYEETGSMGLGLMVQKVPETGMLKIQYATLLNRPHVNKPMSYLSPIATMICQIYRKNKTFEFIDLLSMCLPVAHLCSLYSYLAVLSALSKEDTLSSDPELGLLERIIGDLVEMVGSYNGGGFRRQQCSYNYPTASRDRLASELFVLRGMCLNSTEIPPRGRSYEQHCQERYLHYLKTVKDNIHGAGELMGTHLICVLVLVGLLNPVGVVHCSQFATATSLFKEGQGINCPNPYAQAYINNVSKSKKRKWHTKKDNQNDDRSHRAQRLMESVLPHLRLKFPFMERSFIEQINCESYRKDIVYDFYGPGTSHVFVPPFGSPEAPGLYVMTPEMNLETGRISVVTRLHTPDMERVLAPSFVRHRRNDIIALKPSSPKAEKTQTFVRIPMEYIDSFPGLRKDLMSHFFVTCGANGKRNTPSTDLVTKWISTHPIISKLLRQFMNYPLPKSMTLSAPRAESFRTSGQRKGFKSPQQLVLDYARVQTEPGFAGKQLDSKPPALSPPKACRSPNPLSDDHAGVHTKSDTVFCAQVARLPRSKRLKKHHSLQRDAMFPVLHTSSNMPDLLSSESPFPCAQPTEQPASVYDNIIFKSYKLHGTAGVELVCKKSTGMPTFRRLELNPFSVLTLGPLHAEVKQSLYHGIRSSSMPSVFSKGCFISVFCTDSSHIFRSESSCVGREATMYMSRLLGYELSDFYKVGICSIIDKLAVFTGGRAVPSRKYPGMVNWLFETLADSNKFFVQAIMITSGRPSYFRNLYYRMVKKVRGKSSSGLDIGQVILRLSLPQSEGTLFYAVLQPPHGVHGSNWCLVPAMSAKSKAVDILYMDCWSWKSQIDLQISPVGKAPDPSEKDPTPHTI